MPVRDGSCVVEYLLTGPSVEAVLEIGIARRNLLAKQRPWLQEEKGHGRAGTRARDAVCRGRIEWENAEETLRGEHPEAGAEQCHLCVGPDRLDLTAKLEGMVAADVGQVIRRLEVLFFVEVNTAHKAAGRH